MFAMLERFRRHLADSALVPEGSRVLVGYSGGGDSTALLSLLGDSGIDVVAAHLHHGQRQEADLELEKCQEFAESLDIPFVSGKANVPLMSAELGIGLEEAGRKARYGFFQEASFRLDCGLIATAHTQTDQIETILLNVIRGTGLHGLGGIPARRDNIVRPLLPFSREETRSYCDAKCFWTHDDPANTDLDFSRARVRHRILNEMKLINSGFEAAVLRLSDIATEEDRFLSGMAAAALEQCEIQLNGDLRFLTEDAEIRLERSKFSHMPPVLIKRGLRLASEALGSPLNFDQTNIAMAGVVEGGRGSVSAEGGEVAIEWSERYIEVRRIQSPIPFRYPITIPGETISDDFGWQFTAFEAEKEESPQQRASLETALDLGAIRGPIYFRNMQSGDSMQPLGFPGRRKLADILSDAKLTQAARLRLPIVCDMVGPIWAPGVCLDERAGLNTSSSKVIRVRFSPLKR